MTITGRWVLHRAGVLNVWQYDRAEFGFAGGRLLLRGKNGAGKSKALEVLLPFLFDGDTRRLDATGRDRTTVTWLMTDGRPNGNHVGYVWLELRACDPDGTERFCTLGAGLKASTATRRSDAWFFITDRRVGIDVELERAGECLSIERLKDVLGEEAVTPSGAEHRRRVGRHLFGLFDEARYANVVHLLHRLRDPNIGNRVEAGELASVLTDALPPIDERVLADGAGRFDDLESIRAQVEVAERTAEALGRFLDTYRGYTRTVVRRAAAAVGDADAQQGKAARASRQAERTLADAEHAVGEAEATVAGLRRERGEADDERRALERSDAYRAHQDLVDRHARVDALDVAARTAETAADRAEAAHQRAADEVAVGVRDVRRSAEVTATWAVTADGLAVDAGLDAGLLGAQPSVDGTDQLDATELAGTANRSRAAQVLAANRQRRAGEIRALAARVERAIADADAADERAAHSEGEIDVEREQLAAARAARIEAEDGWAREAREWTSAGLAARCGADWTSALAELDRRDEPATWTAAVRAAVTEALVPVLHRARDVAAVADADTATAAAARCETEEQLQALEAQAEARPAPSAYLDADRDPAVGAPLYKLVDVRPGVDESAAAGVEAALEAAGMLDAWVAADGVVMHPRTHDTIVRLDVPARPMGHDSLATVLQPAVGAEGAVSAATVHAVLAAIGLGEQPDAVAWVAVDGRWAVGALRGAWAKPAVEYLGAGVRRRTRQRQLAELRAELQARESALAEARTAAARAADHRDRVDALPGTLPSVAAVDAAAGDVYAAERSLGAARARHDRDRRAAEHARASASRLDASLAHEAGRDGLPTAVEAVDAVVVAIGELRQALGEHRRALADVQRDHDRLVAAVDNAASRQTEAAEARAEAGRLRHDHRSAHLELATLREAVGAAVDTVLARHEALSDRLARLEHDVVPAAEQRLADAIGTRARAGAAVDHAREAEQAADAALGERGRELERIVALPGVMLAACGRDADGTLTGGALAGVLAPMVGGDDVNDSTLLARYDRLHQELAGGYDTAIEEASGVKVVHVSDDTGRQPLAAVATRLADEAAAARGRLAAREREVLERFLLRELADEVRGKLLDAHDLVDGTNRTLADVRTSHGKGARLEWTLRDDANSHAAVAARLLVDELRDDAGDAGLRDALLALIEIERATDPTASYEQHLRAALDYRGWHRFVVKVTDVAQPGSARVLSNRLGLSQGEQRVLSYLALFAAAAAQFDAIAKETPAAPRLLLLDDAFAKVDEPTHGHLLGLLVELQLDFVLTSERLWGCFPSVPSLEIYEAIRDPAQPGVALMHFRWDGRRRSLVGV
jgi:uncharacterized protein (TIGR02680 family)